MKSDAIASELRERIEAGRLPPEQRPDDALPPGSAIPTVDAIKATYGVSQVTAHAAYRQLSAAGLAHTKQGRPAVVADTNPLYVITNDAYRQARHSPGLTAWELQVTNMGERARTVHYTGRMATPEDLGQDSRGSSVASLLSASEGDELLHLAGDGWATPVGPHGEPDEQLERVVQIYDAWYPASLAEEAATLLTPRDDTEAWAGGAFEVIAKATGREPHTVRRVITERITTTTEAARFRVTPLTLLSAEVEVNVDSNSGEPLSVVWYRRLFGVAQWDLVSS